MPEWRLDDHAMVHISVLPLADQAKVLTLFISACRCRVMKIKGMWRQSHHLTSWGSGRSLTSNHGCIPEATYRIVVLKKFWQQEFTGRGIQVYACLPVKECTFGITLWVFLIPWTCVQETAGWGHRLWICWLRKCWWRRRCQFQRFAGIAPSHRPRYSQWESFLLCCKKVLAVPRTVTENNRTSIDAQHPLMCCFCFCLCRFAMGGCRQLFPLWPQPSVWREESLQEIAEESQKVCLGTQVLPPHSVPWWPSGLCVLQGLSEGQHETNTETCWGDFGQEHRCNIQNLLPLQSRKPRVLLSCWLKLAALCTPCTSKVLMAWWIALYVVKVHWRLNAPTSTDMWNHMISLILPFVVKMLLVTWCWKRTTTTTIRYRGKWVWLSCHGQTSLFGPQWDVQWSVSGLMKTYGLWWSHSRISMEGILWQNCSLVGWNVGNCLIRSHSQITEYWACNI